MKQVLQFIAGAAGVSAAWAIIFIALDIVEPTTAIRMALNVFSIGVMVRVAMQFWIEAFGGG